jgi:hypothetical protein
MSCAQGVEPRGGMGSNREVNDRALIKVHDSRDVCFGSTLSSEHILTNTIEVRGPPEKSCGKAVPGFLKD